MQRSRAERTGRNCVPNRRLRLPMALAAVICCGAMGGDALTAREPIETAVAALTRRLLDAVEAGRVAAADRMLEGIVGDAPSVPTGAGAPVLCAVPRVDAQMLLAEYQSLAELVQGGTALEQDRARDALAGAQAAVADAVTQALPSMTEVDDRRLLVRISLVLPFLATPDDRWDRAATEAALRSPVPPEHVADAEDFALHCGRPLTAWHLSLASGAPTDDIAARLAYLRSAATRMADARDPRAAVACLRAGSRVAGSAGDTHAATVLTAQVANCLADTGHLLDAARCIGTVLADEAQVTDRSALLLRRLAFLYKAGAYEEALREAEAELNRSGRGDESPGLLYMLWTSHQRLGHGTEAGAVAAEFLQRFPRHALAADMLFAKAMSSLAELDYRTADRLLAQIQADFPDCRHGQRVAELRSRLAAVSQAREGQP